MSSLGAHPPPRRSPRQHPSPSLPPLQQLPLAASSSRTRQDKGEAGTALRTRLSLDEEEARRGQSRGTSLRTGRDRSAGENREGEGSEGTTRTGMDGSANAYDEAKEGMGAFFFIPALLIDSHDADLPFLRPAEALNLDLPSLLSHLPSNSTFPPIAPISSTSSFSFTSPSPLPSCSSFDPSASASFSTPSSARCSCTTTSPKRGSASSPPSRLKKRKILHRFYRSATLFSSPSPSSSAFSPRPRQLTQTTSASTWWPSASRDAESRFAPSEEEWTGDASEWSTVQLSFALDALSLSSAVQKAMVPTMGQLPRRPAFSRSASSPAVMGLRPPALEPFQMQAATPETTAELDAAALKQLLLKNLKTRLQSEGGTSQKLSFKKYLRSPLLPLCLLLTNPTLSSQRWVAWNSFTRRQRDAAIGEQDYLSDESNLADEFFAGDFDDDEDMDRSLDFDELPIPPETLSSSADTLSQALEADPFTPSGETSIEDDFLTGPSSFSAFLPMGDTTPSVLVGDATPRTFTTDFANPFPSAPVRPGLRRTTSLPNVSLSSFDAAVGGDGGGGGGGMGWGGSIVACEG